MQIYELINESGVDISTTNVYQAKFLVTPTRSFSVPNNLHIDNGICISWITIYDTGTALYPFTFGHTCQIIFFNGYDTSNLVAVPSTFLVLGSDDRTLPDKGIFVFRIQDRVTGEFLTSVGANLKILLSFWFVGDYEQY